MRGSVGGRADGGLWCAGVECQPAFFTHSHMQQDSIHDYGDPLVVLMHPTETMQGAISRCAPSLTHTLLSHCLHGRNFAAGMEACRFCNIGTRCLIQESRISPLLSPLARGVGVVAESYTTFLALEHHIAQVCALLLEVHQTALVAH